MTKKNWKQKGLTPKLLKENDASYNAVVDLQEALTNEDIYNIALTGPFGAGKSSVIQTLVDKNKNNSLNFLLISLATLDATKATDIEKLTSHSDIPQSPDKSHQLDNETLNRRIEYSILQQLIYKEKQKTLPNSRLRRIPHVPEKSIQKISLNVILFIICFCIVFEPQWLKVEILYRLLNWGYWVNGTFDILSLGIMGYMLYKVVKFIVRTYGNTRLNQIKVAGGEIQIKDENSIFNHYLDEILYFFQCTKYNVVIIEDLDRFNTTDIFLKMRELNFLLNHSDIVGRNIKFVYAIKDDMFSDSSRTKFFDYITTVVPVISPYNSKEKLRSALAELGHSDEIDDRTIREVAFFIDDMRLLQNIANEYHQYRLRLGCNDNHKIDNNKLLAIIVYKNYNPNNFALLPKRSGEIYNALCKTKKYEYQDIAINKVLQNRKDIFQKKREAFNKTLHLKAKELRMLYVFAYLSSFPKGTYKIALDDNNSVHEIPYYYETEEAFNQLISSNKIECYNNTNYYPAQLNIPFQEIEKLVDNNFTYQERLNAITHGIDEIERAESELKLEESLIRTFSVSQLIMKFSLYKEDCYKNIGLSEMADRFIRIGLITEDYHDYISYFYPGMVSANDHSLILDMKLDRQPEYTSHIDNIETFLIELPDDVFQTCSVYNIELLDYLAEHPVLEEERYKLFLRLLSVNKSFDFISLYYKEGKNSNKVLSDYIQNYSHKIWNDIAIAQDYETVMREIWIKFCLIDNIKKTQLMWINENFDFISQQYDSLSETKQDFFTTKTNYNKLTESSMDMLHAVIKNKCYVVSKETMPVIFKHKEAANDITLLSLEEQDIAFQLNLPNPTWKNIYLYFKGKNNEIDESLCKFIEKNAETLCSSKFDGTNDMKEPLFQALMSNNHLNFETYKGVGLSFENITINLTEEIATLEKKRINWLINNGFIEYSDSNSTIIKSLSEEILYNYLAYYRSFFVRDVDEYDYTESLASLILDSSKFTPEEKAIVLTRLDPNITITPQFANSICRILLIRPVELNFTFLKKILKQVTDTTSILKVVILTIGNNKSNFAIIRELLQHLPEPYPKITENGKRPIVEKSSLNKFLLNLLMECGYISSYSIEDKGFRINTRQKVD